MEKLKDILANIKERFSNPLIFSFICSWLIINWRITIAVIWHDNSQVEKAGSKSIYDFVGDHINLWDSLIHPLIFAIAYTLVMPIIRNLIRALQSWATKWGENWSLEITKGMKIPFEKYLRFREEYEKRGKILEEVITKESVNLTLYDKAKTELLESKNLNNEMKQQVNEANELVSNLFNEKILNGYWTNTYKNKLTNEQGREEVFIEDEKYYILGNFNERKFAFKIINFCYNKRNNYLFFIKDVADQTLGFENGRLRFNINQLEFRSDDLLVGKENGTTDIQYERKKMVLP